MSTKEELTKENGKLKWQVNALEESDAEIRQQFTRILRESVYYEREGIYGGSKQTRTLTWLEITAEVGKLLADHSQIRMEKDLDRMRVDLGELIRQQNKEDGQGVPMQDSERRLR